MKIHPASTTSAGAHVHNLRVYYEDTDAGGVVYHANYLRFIERARTEALRALGIPHAELVEHFCLMFVVRRIEMDYLAPARLDDSLTVLTSVKAVGGASVRLHQSVTAADGSVLAAATVHLACVNPGQAKARRIPARWRDALRAMCDSGAAHRNRTGLA